ncbi:VacJ family lipoprotein [Oceanospirillum sediminis]
MNAIVNLRAFCLVALLFSGMVVADAPSDPDPWEGWNRNVHGFNETLDTYIARPVAQGYRLVTPGIVRQGVGNFFSNLGEIPTAVNDLLQAKPGDAATATGRFLINSTLGVLGLIDVASMAGIEEHREDFGQTLAVWGVGSGPYLVLPVLGPSTLRDTFSLYPDYLLDPVQALPVSDEEKMGLNVLKLVHRRHQLLDSESIVQGDKYIFIRDAYLQSRHYEINDGQVEDSFDSDLDDIDLDDDF